MLLVLVPEVSDKPLKFLQESDGWYANRKNKLAIDPDKKTCIQDPWYADHICPPREYKYRVLE